MNYPKEIWADTDLVCSDKPHEGWQKYQRVDEMEIPKGMKLSRVEMMDGKPVACFIEDKPKCPLCGDTGMVRNDQSPQGWDDCIRCEIRMKCATCGGTWA